MPHRASLAKSDVKEVEWWARQLLRPAPAPTKTFGTLHKQWRSLLRTQNTRLLREVAPMFGVVLAES